MNVFFEWRPYIRDIYMIHGFIIVALLLLVLAHQHVQFRLLQNVADKLGLPEQSHLKLLMGSNAAVSHTTEPAPPAVTTSSFSSGPTDFMAHARRMDTRVNSPAAKTEALLMNNDRAQRKLRSALVKGG